MRRILYVLLGVLLVPTVGLVGDVVTDGKFKSTLQREPPLEVASSVMVVDLNADTVDGLDASDFALTSDTYTKAEVDALVAAAAEADSRRRLYLTTSTYWGSEPLTVCESGFHMASMWEIQDVSNLRYDTVRGYTKPDSGMGPPQGLYGWIRTGGDASSASTPGVGNCNGWSTLSFSSYGTRASLPNPAAHADYLWTAPATRSSPWAVSVEECDLQHRVWCVED